MRLRIGSGLQKKLDDDVERIHREVDEAVAALLEKLAVRGASLRCGLGCTDCCRDGVTVFEVEAEWIRNGFKDALRGEPAPEGRCAFLDERGACRIYERRPYVCRTQGLPLRWLDDDDAGDLVERRDLCPINDETVPLLELDEDECWTLGAFEGRLATVQAATKSGDGVLQRIELRQLAETLLRSIS